MNIPKKAKLRALVATIGQRWEQIHVVLAEAIAPQKPSCSAGCSACCDQPVGTSMFDGLLIADALLKKPDWHALLPRLQAKGQGRGNSVLPNLPGEEPKRYSACVFLDPGTRLCTIYAVRPMQCRTHYVRSDPSQCSLENGPDQLVERFDASKMHAMAMNWEVEVLGAWQVGNLPHIVLLGLYETLKARGDIINATKVRQHMRGLNAHNLGKAIATAINTKPAPPIG